MTVYGKSIIGGEPVQGRHGSMRSVNPASGEALEPEIGYVGAAEVDKAAQLAASSFDAYRAHTHSERARFLEAIADNLDATRDEIVERATAETGLPVGRLLGEHARTTGQLRRFADELRLGAHQGVRIDEGQPNREPAPAPDLRQRMIPLGPVVVFGASNFPLAFSTAGGDTASALAAGCPVIVKAHNSHAGTAELAGQAIAAAVASCSLPPGTFALVFGRGTEIGQQLAVHPAVKAIAFTGSRSGGTTLMRTAAARDEPIPVYAEMSSINPVILLPGALEHDAGAVARGFVGSLTLGSGQFCTNPGLVLIPKQDHGFSSAVAAEVEQSVGQTMLSSTIGKAFIDGLTALDTLGAKVLATGSPGPGANAPGPVAYHATAADLRANPGLQEEVFGPAALLVTYEDLNDLRRTLEELQGQLTITVHAEASDLQAASTLLPVLERKAGRLVVNGWPTGVEVAHAMVHGGPFPATSDSRTTSVGTLAIERFQRPVSYQSFPPQLVPDPVRADNPLNLPRRLNGSLHTAERAPR